jgi:hypothetical protein
VTIQRHYCPSCGGGLVSEPDGGSRWKICTTPQGEPNCGLRLPDGQMANSTGRIRREIDAMSQLRRLDKMAISALPRM